MYRLIWVLDELLFLPPDEAFVLSEPHVSAMFQCLEAVEQNNPRLLALIDTVRVRLVLMPTLPLTLTVPSAA